MKKAVLHFLSTMRAACLCGGCFSPFAFYLCGYSLRYVVGCACAVFICGCFSSVSYASPPPANDVHICEVLDYEDMRARDSLYAAAKQALDLNVGEPRTVRMIYFLPNDRPFQQAVVDSMKVTIRQVQTFYAGQMEAHGYGRKTFRFETDAQGEPMVHRVDGRHPDSHYRDDTLTTVFGEVRQVFDFFANIYLVVVDNETETIGRGNGIQVTGVAAWGIRKDALIPDDFHWTTAAHEIGHTFGLGHDFRDEAYIMSYGKSQRSSLSACHAEFLSVEPYFNTDSEDKNTSPPTIELISPTAYPTGSTSVLIQLRVSDSDGLHQVLLFTGGSLKACRGLNGEKEAVVQFDYDGLIPSPSDPHGTGTSFSDPLVHRIRVEAVDSFGNASLGSLSFRLVDISTQRNLIATLEGHTSSVNSVTFSPDGTTLASGSRDRTIKLWDMSLYITSSTPASASDFDGDGTVDFPDFLLLVEKYGLSEKDEAYQARFDLDGDGIIGFGDFLIFVDNFGKKVS